MSVKDPLARLWQQQKVEVPTTEQLQKLWQKEKRKQLAFMCYDLFGLIFIFLGYWYLSPSLNWFVKLWLIVVMVFVIAFTAYVTWLRRLALFRQKVATDDYLSLIEKQCTQNIKLSKSTKLVVYIMPLFFAVMIAGTGFFEIYSDAELVAKALKSTGLLALVLIPTWIWADKRQKRFVEQLEIIRQQK